MIINGNRMEYKILQRKLIVISNAWMQTITFFFHEAGPCEKPLFPITFLLQPIN